MDQKWRDYGASADRDRMKYGYDRASSRIWREVTLVSGKDEFYSYDGLHRLTVSQRGDLNAGKTAISATPVEEEDFALDSLGNWGGYVQKSSGSTDLDQSRSANKVNEITDIDETVGTSWATPAYDRNRFAPTPAWPADTDQFGVYYVRAPCRRPARAGHSPCQPVGPGRDPAARHPVPHRRGRETFAQRDPSRSQAPAWDRISALAPLRPPRERNSRTEGSQAGAWEPGRRLPQPTTG